MEGWDSSAGGERAGGNFMENLRGVLAREGPPAPLDADTVWAIDLDEEERFRQEEAEHEAAAARRAARQRALDEGFLAGVDAAKGDFSTSSGIPPAPPTSSPDGNCSDCRLRPPTHAGLCDRCIEDSVALLDLAGDWEEFVDRYVKAVLFSWRYGRLETSAFEWLQASFARYPDGDFPIQRVTEAILTYAAFHQPLMDAGALDNLIEALVRPFEGSILHGWPFGRFLTTEERDSLKNGTEQLRTRKAVTEARLVVKQLRDRARGVLEPYFRERQELADAAFRAEWGIEVEAIDVTSTAVDPPSGALPTGSPSTSVEAEGQMSPINRPTLAPAWTAYGLEWDSESFEVEVSYHSNDGLVHSRKALPASKFEGAEWLPGLFEFAAELARSGGAAIGQAHLAGAILTHVVLRMYQRPRAADDDLLLLCAGIDGSLKSARELWEERAHLPLVAHGPDLCKADQILRATVVRTRFIRECIAWVRSAIQAARNETAKSIQAARRADLEFEEALRDTDPQALPSAQEEPGSTEMSFGGKKPLQHDKTLPASNGGRSPKGENLAPAPPTKPVDEWLRGTRAMREFLRNEGYPVASKALNDALNAGEVHGAKRRKVGNQSPWFAHVAALRTWGKRRYPEESLHRDE